MTHMRSGLACHDMPISGQISYVQSECRTTAVLKGRTFEDVFSGVPLILPVFASSVKPGVVHSYIATSGSLCLAKKLLGPFNSKGLYGTGNWNVQSIEGSAGTGMDLSSSKTALPLENLPRESAHIDCQSD